MGMLRILLGMSWNMLLKILLKRVDNFGHGIGHVET
jgi:hypothetical protein